MTATLLPNAIQQFIGGNGVPLAGGTVYFYIPNTSTPKNTWQDAGETILNTNPVLLNASGEAIIYGTGEYRQVVYDVHGNLIWDALTQDVTQAIQSSVALFCGTSTGSANAQIVSPSPAVTSISTGQQFSFFAGFTCTGPMTITISALTYAIYVGAPPNVAGNVVAGMATLIQFDGTHMQLINPQPEYSLPAPGTSGNLLQSNGTIWTSATPLLPPPGTSGNVLTSNGAAWTSAPLPPIGGSNQQTFTTVGTSTWTAPSGYNSSAPVLVEAWGAGGGGAGGSSSGGGGGGAYKYGWYVLSALGATVTVTVGAGGIGGGTASPGGNGGISSFGSFLTAYGGTGGSQSTGNGGTGNGGASGGYASTANAGSNTNDSGGEGWGGTTGNNGFGGFYSGGGGGGNSAASGGPSVYGGGGGSGAEIGGTGGLSVFGGNGGNFGNAGTAPGGGGSAENFAGAAGQVRITVFG